MTISLPIKVFLGGLAIIVSLVSAAHAGRPLINDENACKAVAKYYNKKWGGSGNYKTKGCYYYENGKYGGKAYYGGYDMFYQNANTGDGKKTGGKRRFDQLCVTQKWSKGFQLLRSVDPVWMLSGSHMINCDCANTEARKVFGHTACN